MQSYKLVMLLAAFLGCSTFSSVAQLTGSDSAIKKVHLLENKDELKRNMLKINLYSLLVNNYSFAYERMLTRKFSVQLSYRFQPYSYLLDNIAGRELSKYETIDPRYYGFQTSNNTVTLDFKYYVGRKFGAQGLYIGIYGRYALFDLDNIGYTYLANDGSVYNVPLISNLKGIGGGISIGRQWIIKKRIIVESYILSGHYGVLTGSLSTKKDLSNLSADEQNNIKQNIEDLYTLGGKKYLTAIVTDNGITGKISGPFFGIRTGISIGYAF